MWVTINSGPEQGTTTEVTGPRFVIGRDDDCDFVVDDEKVSRHHAALTTGTDGVTIRDLGSSNGTFVNGKRIHEPHPLAGDEHVRVGDTALVLSRAKPGSPDPGSPPPGAAVIAVTPPPDEPAGEPPPPGRATIERIVHEAVEDESRRTRRSVALASILGALVAAGALVGILFATGTIGGGESGSSVTPLERATVLIEGLDRSGNVMYIGSGTIIRPDGLILTNAHVGAPKAAGLDVLYGVGLTSDPAPASFAVSLFQGEAEPAKQLYLAKAVAADGYVDAAVLKIVRTIDGKDVAGLKLPTVPIGNSDRVRDGEQVTVVGYPGVGGGFEHEINVSRGAISGFQRDSHIPATTRGWIKTDAAIAHGNSGGLAADPEGRLIGIPSRVQCGSSLSSPCTGGGEDRQGKIRPVNLALPVIRAAEHGRTWSTPYVVRSTGKESFSFSHWAPEDSSDPCGSPGVQSYPAGTASIVAVFHVSGIAPEEDLALLAFATPATGGRSYVADQTTDRWPKTGKANCYWWRADAGQGAGRYSVQAFGGPTLQPISREATVDVG